MLEEVLESHEEPLVKGGYAYKDPPKDVDGGDVVHASGH